MFQMTVEEFENWKPQIVTSNSNSDRIIRAFVKLRKLLQYHEETVQIINDIQTNDSEQDNSIRLIFEYLKQLEQDRQSQSDYKERRTIGFKIDGS